MSGRLGYQWCRVWAVPSWSCVTSAATGRWGRAWSGYVREALSAALEMTSRPASTLFLLINGHDPQRWRQTIFPSGYFCKPPLF